MWTPVGEDGCHSPIAQERNCYHLSWEFRARCSTELLQCRLWGHSFTLENFRDTALCLIDMNVFCIVSFCFPYCSSTFKNIFVLKAERTSWKWEVKLSKDLSLLPSPARAWLLLGDPALSASIAIELISGCPNPHPHSRLSSETTSRKPFQISISSKYSLSLEHSLIF